MRRLWLLAAAALLAACSTETASCAPCPGPGFVAIGLPETTAPAVVRTCVDDEPCQSTKVGRSPEPGSLELVPLATQGDWASYDGRRISVTVRVAGHRWRGGGELVYHPDGGGTCSCPGLVARVRLSRVG